MELRIYFTFLRKWWLSLVSVTLLGVLVAAVVTITATPTYQATTRLFVSTLGAGTTSDLAQGNQFVQQQVQSYSNIATGDRVLQPVIDQLGLDETPGQLAQRVSAQAPFNTVLVSITVTDTTPERAASTANAIGSSLIAVVTELEQGSGSVGQSPVSLQTVESAQLPTSPASPSTRTNLTLGLLAGLAAAVALAALREALDTAVRSEKDLEQLSLTTLAVMPWNDESSLSHPVMVDAPHSGRAEAFRQLRTSVQFVIAAGGSRSLLITSASEGDGKTTTAVNLAIALASVGSRVALVDADLRRPMVAQSLGLEGDAGLTSVLAGQASLEEVLQAYDVDGLLHVLTAGVVPPNPSELLASDAMQKVLHELESGYDVVVVDGAPLLPVTDSVVLSELVGGVLLVVASDRTKRPQLTRAIASVRAVDARLRGAVLTMVTGAGSSAYAYGSATSAARRGRLARLRGSR